MSQSFHFEADEPVTVGTLGPKGQRVFYLQCRSRNGPVSFKMEKQQVAALAEYLDRMLDGLPPAPADAALTDDSPADFDLRTPVEAEWAVGNMGVAYDGDDDRIILVAEERAEDDDDSEAQSTEPASARFTLTREQVAGFVGRARTVVAAGRPPCPYCARPLEEAHGDWCPCHN